MHLNETLLIVVFLVPFILMVIAIVDLFKRNLHSTSDKLLWIFLIILIPVLGALLYLIIGRRSSARSSNSVLRS
jgi:hypothetical protein